MKQLHLVAIMGLILVGLTAGAGTLWAQHSVSHGARAMLRGPALATRLHRQIAQRAFQSGAQAGKGIYHVSQINQGVFCAHAQKGNDAFSGGVFQVTRDGEKEVFGFIAAHSLADVPSGTGERRENQYYLNRFFEMKVEDQWGNQHLVEAEVVALSSPKMLDIALVKFRPGDEKLFNPFPLRQTPLKEGEELVYEGFSERIGQVSFSRKLLEQSPISLRTDMMWPRLKRVGFCGGALLDHQRQLVGIHTGSHCGSSLAADIGFATYAHFLNLLVDEFHHKGNVTFPLELGGKKTIDLAPDEHIITIDFFDKHGEKIGLYITGFKFSYSTVNDIIQEKSPRYLRFLIGKTGWSDQDPAYVEESVSRREVTYDLKRGRVVSKEVGR